MAEGKEQQIPLLSRLRPPVGAVRAKIRKGRGPGSGLGKTAGRGQKGQKSRSGKSQFAGFEGGQMPLQRRLPKVGFHNHFEKCVAAVNVGELNRFAAQSVIDTEALIEARLVRGKFDSTKVLGGGDLDRALTVRAHAFSASAKEKIEKAGGKAELIESPKAGSGQAAQA
jgi:large subunit ribosomal protein L15